MKRILVPLIGQSGDRNALDAAAAIAKGHGAHVEARLFQRNPRDVMPIVGEGFSAAMVEQVMEAAESTAQAQVKGVTATFEAWSQTAGVTVGPPSMGEAVTTDFETVIGGIPGGALSHMRVADLIVFARPMKQGQPDRSALLEAAMMDSGRPVLLVPDDGTVSKGETVVVAWNGSAEAARAVAVALPVLKQAKSVTVVTIKDDDVHVQPQDLVDTLAMNGVSAKAVLRDPARAGVAAAIDEEAAKVKADLILIGAYSHSRFREFIMGGVTDDVLTEYGVPVLLVH